MKNFGLHKLECEEVVLSQTTKIGDSTAAHSQYSAPFLPLYRTLFASNNMERWIQHHKTNLIQKKKKKTKHKKKTCQKTQKTKNNTQSNFLPD